MSLPNDVKNCLPNSVKDCLPYLVKFSLTFAPKSPECRLLCRAGTGRSPTPSNFIPCHHDNLQHQKSGSPLQAVSLITYHCIIRKRTKRDRSSTSAFHCRGSLLYPDFHRSVSIRPPDVAAMGLQPGQNLPIRVPVGVVAPHADHRVLGPDRLQEKIVRGST